MKKDWIKSVNLNTISGVKIICTAAVKLSKSVDLDGQVDTVDCCETDLFLDVDGHGRQYNLLTLDTPKTINGVKIVATFGKVGLTDDNYQIVCELKKDMLNHPAVIAKNQKIKKNEAAIKKYDKSRKDLCPKCGSYCYGDCTAN